MFDDWSWLNGVKIGSENGQEIVGGEKLRNYVNGIGFEVTKVDNKDNWEGKEWKRDSKINLKRVLMSNYEGYYYGGGYKSFDKGSCLLKTSNKNSESGPQIYLLIGFSTSKSLKNVKTRPTDFSLTQGFSDFCDWYDQGKYSHDGKKSISISFDLVDGKTITGKEFPVIADSKSFTPLAFPGKNGNYISPIVLGVAIKGQMFPSKEGSKVGEHLTKERAIRAIQKKINSEIIGMYPKDRKRMVGLKIQNANGSDTISGETTSESWTTDISATYKYQYS